MKKNGLQEKISIVPEHSVYFPNPSKSLLIEMGNFKLLNKKPKQLSMV